MATARHSKNLVFSVPDDDGLTVGETCTAKQERFAQEWARTGNKAAAYRLAYDVHPRTAPGTMWAYASRISSIPCVQKRFHELQQQSALETIISIQEALQWQIDIATADPNEIGYVAKRACRYCYGENHRYQWVDDAEYLKACIEAIDSGGSPPSDEGGYGYTRALDPAVTCPQCLGDGIAETVVNDTTKLQGKARKLYKGLDFKNGEWVVLMHDQAKAWEMACRMLGAFNDKLQLTPPGSKSKTLEGPLTEQEAARSYLALIG